MAMPGVEEMSHCDYVQVAAVFVGLFVFWLLREMFCLVIFFQPTRALSDLITFMICTCEYPERNRHIMHIMHSTNTNSYEKYIMQFTVTLWL